MLEVIFSDSEKGALKLAKTYDAKSILGGTAAIGYIGQKPAEDELKKHFEGVSIGGNAKDVVCIGFSLDIGNISGDVDGIERQECHQKIWGRFGIDKNEQEQFFQHQRKDLEKLLTTARNGIPIRIWESDAPYSTCGLYFTCHALRDVDCKISVIHLPKYAETADSKIISYSHWGEVEPGKFYKFLPLEKQLSPLEKRMFSNHWCDLMVENSLIRALVNGKLISVPDNFYDHMITRNIPDDNFIMANLIGKILGKYPLGISDSLIALRIDTMVAEGKLAMIDDKDPSHPYGKILRKAIL